MSSKFPFYLLLQPNWMWVEGTRERHIDAKTSNLKSIQISFNLTYSLLNQDLKLLWTTSLTSPSKKSSNWVNQDHTRKEDTDHPLFQPMLVSSPLISTSTEEKCTTGVLAVTPRMVLGAMVNASGFWQDADQFNSTSQSLATTSSATANFLPMPHSAMELTNTWSNGFISTTEASGVFGELVLSGLASSTGPSLSTSEQSIADATGDISACLQLYLNFL